MSVLDDIIVGVREDLAARRRELSEAELARAAAEARTPLDPMPELAAPGLSVIAEVKRRSPSKGHLADIPDPEVLAAAYASGGADAISVLTEQRRFGGSLEDLRRVRAAVPTPLLRKDFVVEGYQLFEARALGADLVLLIVAALDDHRLADLHQQARDLGLTPLVEVHDAAEVDRAAAVGATLVGVNARDLRTLEVHPDAFGRLAPRLADAVPDAVLVAESGIAGVDDARRVHDLGAGVVLVGEALVRHGDPAAALAAMKEACRR